MPTTKILIRESKEGEIERFSTHVINHTRDGDLQNSRDMWLALLQNTAESLLIISKSGELVQLDALTVQVSFED